LNDAKAGEGEGTFMMLLRKITKYFILDGRRIWVTEYKILLLNHNTFSNARKEPENLP
jgi:hypothetical protein